MKKFTVIALFVVYLFFIFSSSVFAAAGGINFELSDEASLPNRLVTFEMKAKSDSMLCAASFELVYDKNVLEFRSAKVGLDGCDIASECNNGKVKLVYLDSDGHNISAGEVIFSITFKANAESYGYIDFSVSDCVTDNIEWLEVESCKSGEYNISKNIKADNDNSKSSKSDNKDNDTASKSKRSTVPTETHTTSIDELGVLNPIADTNFRLLLIGFSGGVGLLSFCFIGYTVYCKKFKKKNTDENNGADD